GRYYVARWRWLGGWERFSTLEHTIHLQRRAPATGYLMLLCTAGALILAFLLRGLPLVAFLLAMLALVVAAAWERRDSPAILLACLLAATGLALGIFVEFFALQGDIGRMNTVFKFYLQVWVMWGLVSAVALAWTLDRMFAPRLAGMSSEFRVPSFELGNAAPSAVSAGSAVAAQSLLYESPAATGTGDGDTIGWAEAPRPGEGYGKARGDGVENSELGTRNSDLPLWAWAWLAGAGALILAVLAYPLGGTPARLADRFHPLPPTLDGMAYMQYAAIPDGSSEVTAAHPGGVTLRAGADYRAIQWLLANVQGSPVILEASVPEYRWGTRVAKYTGLPAVLGWRWHQVQQRGAYASMVDQRLRDVQTMFNDPSRSQVLPLLEKYQVRYVYVGDLERAYYAAGGLAKFDQMTDVFQPVYQQDGVTIYEVVGNR
ncbi:MAG: DUF2298 domain-containing protein, partial [Chloroflexota bacterium]